MSELITTKTEYGEFGISLNPLNYVVQANDLIEAMPNLSLNATKLLRIMIMQIKPDDEEFFQLMIYRRYWTYHHQIYIGTLAKSQMSLDKALSVSKQPEEEFT